MKFIDETDATNVLITTNEVDWQPMLTIELDSNGNPPKLSVKDWLG